MSIKKYIGIILEKGNGIRRMDLNAYYMTSEYKEVVKTAKECIDLQGVKELLEELHHDNREYMEKMKRIIDEERNQENSKYTLWNKVHNAKNICKWITIGAFLLCMVGLFFKSVTIIFSWLISITMLILPVGIILTLILKIAVMICGKLYQSYIQKLEGKVRNINGNYSSKIKAIDNKVDRLYLASLEPAHREMVLMRRDQERQHQKLIKSQQKYQQNMQKKQNAYNRASLEEQEKIRRTQERLLDIEERREDRYYKW